MPQKLYVGNLPYRTTEDDLRQLFKKYEPIHSLILVADKETDQPRGYSFVELDEPQAGDALYDLKGTEFNGRNLRISVATGRPPKDDGAEKTATRRRNANRKNSDKKASDKKVQEKNGQEKNSQEKKILEKRKEYKPNTAAIPRRNHQTTTTEYIVSDTDNYG
jgi:RNA recognition motif-containing protein